MQLSMQYRSWLIARADDPAQLAEAAGTSADAIVVDLEGGASIGARKAATEWLATHRKRIVAGSAVRWVRINPMSSRVWRDDLIAVMASAPDGVILPRAEGPDAIRLLGAEIYELEQRHQIPAGQVKVIPVVGETPQSALTIPAYLESPHQRLAGLSWSGEYLCQAIGATRLRDVRHGLTDTARVVRAQALLAAHGCGIIAIEAPVAAEADAKTVRQAARDARADGFTGMLVRHPAHVAPVNATFTPTEAEVAEARRVIAAYNGEGSVLDRRTIELPQLRNAERVVAMSKPVAEAPRTAILRPA